MELTTNLPVAEWYVAEEGSIVCSDTLQTSSVLSCRYEDGPDNNATYWPLDYPPLSGYQVQWLSSLSCCSRDILCAYLSIVMLAILSHARSADCNLGWFTKDSHKLPAGIRFTPSLTDRCAIHHASNERLIVSYRAMSMDLL